MQAVVLVGGEGTRLRPLTLTQPKPAVPLVDRPFIRYLVDWLGRHGIDEVIMACGFKAETLREALGDDVPGGPSIRYLQEDEPLGTAGPVRLAADQGLLGDRFMVLNGDSLTDLDLTALERQHEETGAVLTLGLYPVEDVSSFGLVRRDDDGVVLGFLEKPDPAEVDTDEVSAGCYVIERQVLDLIPPGAPSRSSARSFRASSARACTVAGWRVIGWTSEHRSAISRRAGTSSRERSRPSSPGTAARTSPMTRRSRPGPRSSPAP